MFFQHLNRRGLRREALPPTRAFKTPPVDFVDFRWTRWTAPPSRAPQGQYLRWLVQPRSGL